MCILLTQALFGLCSDAAAASISKQESVCWAANEFWLTACQYFLVSLP